MLDHEQPMRGITVLYALIMPDGFQFSVADNPQTEDRGRPHRCCYSV